MREVFVAWVYALTYLTVAGYLLYLYLRYRRVR